MAETYDVILRARGEFSDLISKVSNLKKEFSTLKLPKDIGDNLEKSFNKLDPLLKSYQKQLDKGFKTNADLKSFESIRNEVDAVFNEINNNIQKINGQPIQLKADLKEINKLEKQLTDFQNKLQKALDNITIDKGNTVSSNIEKLINSTSKSIDLKPLTIKAQDLFNKQDFASFNSEIDKLRDKILSLSNEKGAKVDLAKSLMGPNFKNDIAAMDKVISDFFNKTLKVPEDKLHGLEKCNRDIVNTGTALSQLKTDSLERGAQAVASFGSNAKTASSGMNQLGASIGTAADKSLKLSTELSQLETSAQYFFGLRNMINLFRRGVRSAVDTVKELDAAMTETAVVTQFSVKDMWAKLPEYTSNAKALGATIQDMYESTTLYYQQGLNTEQAMGIATETMKMARIAGLEAADATDMMTAALRGFNMEINETSAEHINDVYSNLAAKTASNTEELGTAMQRTASIAASAGMSFEGTAAFLAQAIETTREPAENLGTAMKTIVARFTELKKNPLEIVEVDGEEVSYNKVDTALQSIGVSLKDANGQFRALDEVFLDISKKWDGLSQTQQRYIATMAAGSRQQSRFIAMMSNYERTMELMDYANNSAGASAEQFGKTMDSLEAKINRFKDTWQEFLMNIANESAIKGLVNGATKALEILNKLIETISKIGSPFGLEGFNKSILSLGAAFIGLRTLGRGANGLIRGMGGMLDPRVGFRQGFTQGWTTTRQEMRAASITNPIISAIRELIPHIDKAAQTNSNYRFQDKGNYAQAKSDLNQLMMGTTGIEGAQLTPKGTYTVQGLLDIFEKNQLNPQQQKKFFQTEPGLRRNLVKSYQKLLKDVGESPKNAKSLVSGLASGDIVLEEALSPKIASELNKTYAQAYQDIKDKYGVTDLRKLSGEARINARQEVADLKAKAGVTDTKGLVNNTGLVHQEEIDKFNNTPKQLTDWEKAMKGVAGTSQAMLGLGMAAQMVGSMIGDTNEELGDFISSLGSVMTTIGMVGMAITAFSALSPPLMAVALGVTAIAGAFVYLQKQSKKIKEAGKEVTETFKKENDEAQNNISSLKQYQAEAERWANGVDRFGNNISLSDEEYSAYLEAVEKIAEINPEIVEGYNAQGRAIIDINKALNETIALQKQRQDEALKEYTSEASLDKLIKARDEESDYWKVTHIAVDWSVAVEEDPTLKGQGRPGDTIWKEVPAMSEDVVKNAQQLIEKGILEEADFTELGIDFQKLLAYDQVEIDKYLNSLTGIHNLALKKAEEKDIDFTSDLTTSFTDIEDKVEKFDEVTAEIVQCLQTYGSNLQGFEDIPQEFRTYVMSGIEKIAQSHLTPDEMTAQTQNLVRQFSTLTSKGSKYAVIMGKIQREQQKFSKTLNADEYQKSVETYASQLEAEADRLSANGDAVSIAMAEFYQSQADAARQFTENGQYRLVEALNGMISAIQSAEGALDSFKEATKTDYSTGAENMKAIYDAVFEGGHTDAYGDNTFWTGAEMLLGADTIRKITEGKEGEAATKAVEAAMKKLSPMLQEGEEGFAAFWDTFAAKAASLDIEGFTWNEKTQSYDIDRKLNPQVYEELANAYNMSTDFLMSMLSKGRQYAEIDFMDTDMVRAALGADEAAIKNGSNIFVKDEYIRDALREAKVSNVVEQDQYLEKLANEGVYVINPPESFTSADAQKLGISDLPSLVKTLGDTGQFNRDEILEYAKGAFGEDYVNENYDQVYDEYVTHRDNELLTPVESIQDTTKQIAGYVQQLLAGEGVVTQDAVDAAQKMREEVRGGEGDDTMVQMFGQGRTESGELLTEAQFAQEYQEIQAMREEAAAMRDAAVRAQEEATKKMEEAGEGTEAYEYWKGEAEKADQIIADTDAVIASIDANLQEGTENWSARFAETEAKNIATGPANEAANQTFTDTGSIIEARKKYDEVYQSEYDNAYQQAHEWATNFVESIEKGTYDAFNSGDNKFKYDPSKLSNTTPTTSAPPSNAYTDTGTKGEEISTEPIYRYVFYSAEGDYANIVDFNKELEEDQIKQIEVDYQQNGIDPSQNELLNDNNIVVLTDITVSKDDVSPRLQELQQSRTTTTVTIKPDYGNASDWTKTVTIHVNKTGDEAGNGYTGLSNKISYIHVPQAGSLAGGTKKGRVGPRNQGGLTLTGERGYEIAWLPDENRSVILGANGPQMINLPKSAVVYNHDQSKDIMKKRATIPAGSMDSGSYTRRYTRGTTGGTTQSKNKGTSKSKTSKKNKNINNFSIEEVIRFDIDQSLSVLNSEINITAKNIEKSLEKIGTVYDDIAGSVKNQVAALEKVRDKNKKLIASYQRQLKEIDEGTYKEVVSWTNSKGKSVDATYNLSKYIYRDNDGAYKVDIDKIKQLGSKAEREAVYNAASKAISGLQSGLLKAQDAVDDAERQIEELGKKVSETFYQWENELTEIYDLTQRIEDEISFTDRFTSQVELELSKLNAGFGDTAVAIENIRNVLVRNVQNIERQIEDQQQMIAARQRELNDMLSSADEQALLEKYRNMTGVDAETKKANIQWAEDQKKIADTALKYVTNVFRDLDGSVRYEIDWSQFNKDLDQSPINKETYEAVKQYLDNLNDAQKEFNDAITTQTDFLKEIPDALRDYQEKVADFEDTLIKGLEEEIKQEAENARKLSDSIANALSDLLDEVKRKLDERRKQEDNAKTERDLSQKQQRLAALRADTSGSNKAEIAQLEKEITDAQQSYQRTLEDQLLEKLQQQADDAKKQRERQIELAETANEIASDNNKELVDIWLKDPNKYREEIKAAWLEANGYDEKGEAGQYILEKQFDSLFAELVTAVEQSGFNNSEQIFTAIEGDTNTLVYLLNKISNEQVGRYDELSLGENRNDALVDATERNTQSLENLTASNESAQIAKQSNVDANTLKQLGYTAQDLIGDANNPTYSAKELYDAGFKAQDLINAGITSPRTLKEAGYKAKDLVDAGINNATDLKNAGFTIQDLKDLFNIQDLIEAAFSAKDLKSINANVSTLKNAGFSLSELKDAGYSLSELGKNFTAAEFGANGLSYADAKAAGYTKEQLQYVDQYAKTAKAEIDKQNKYNAYINYLKSVKKIKPANVKSSHVNQLFKLGAAAGYGKASVLSHLVGGTGGSDPFSWKNIFKAIINADGISRYNLVKTWPNGNSALADALKTLGNPDTYSEIKKKSQYKKAKALAFKTGGLADYTGPAWLDGTPSKPELVLNAKDTQNFIALRDVLSKAINSTDSASNTYGDITYEININVDHLNNDYDVDKVVEKVKKEIVKGSGYRNVTQVRAFK